MTLLRRIMWPNKGEEIALYKDGALVAEGEVTHSDDKTVSITGKRLNMFNISVAELERGIENRTIVVKKRKVQ